MQTCIRDSQKQPPEVYYEESVLKISRNPQENTCARVSFLTVFVRLFFNSVCPKSNLENKRKPATLLKKDSDTGVFL